MIFFFQAEDGIRDLIVTGVQTCALPIFEDRSDGGRVLLGLGARTAARRLRRGGIAPARAADRAPRWGRCRRCADGARAALGGRRSTPCGGAGGYPPGY